ncbi:hypothetical protein MTZ49_11395 [Entomomonas sp. E2T0]|uniref:hypothetical protein n=1 Tax=Entomomonas sp. E2T0 TaxID=2930213 RepID=UPI0022283BD1|nr:hypothetical protein [Entomomonas sp. E2T0]UYZ83199.1 hypothetical protein MTZ49_11395 [Entomomonas sp. E2T0]
MKKVILYIHSKKQQFSKLPLFDLLKNEEFSSKEKLSSTLPIMSHFIMSFGDLNKYVLKYTEPKNELEKVVNTHAKEDQDHWKWFIDDLKTLQINNIATLPEHLMYLWDSTTSSVRELTYTLIGEIYNSSAKQRLAIIEAMEATGNVMFKVLAPLANDVKLKYNKELVFCGNTHLSHETGHTIGSEQRLFDNIAFNTNELELIKQKIDIVFEAFTQFINLLFKLIHYKLLQNNK